MIAPPSPLVVEVKFIRPLPTKKFFAGAASGVPQFAGSVKLSVIVWAGDTWASKAASAKNNTGGSSLAARVFLKRSQAVASVLFIGVDLSVEELKAFSLNAAW